MGPDILHFSQQNKAAGLKQHSEKQGLDSTLFHFLRDGSLQVNTVIPVSSAAPCPSI